MLKTPMLDKLPMTLLAQCGDVSIFQTAAAYPTAETVDSTDKADIIPIIDRDEFADKPLLIKGQHSYGELNLGLHVKDNPATVLNHRMRVLAAINQQLQAQNLAKISNSSAITRLHWVNQVHGKQVYDTDTAALSMCPVDADSMLSTQSRTGLAIMTADCVPIVLYQPSSGQIAAVHAGWQGLACGVIKATLARFCDDGQVLAWIGACISQDHYEVGRQVYEQLLTGCSIHQLLSPSCIDNFAALFCATTDSSPTPLQNTAAQSVKTAPIEADKVRINLPKLAAAQLAFFGVACRNELPVPCSYADSQYYSYRLQTHLQQPATGRMALIIVRLCAIMA